MYMVYNTNYIHSRRRRRCRHRRHRRSITTRGCAVTYQHTRSVSRYDHHRQWYGGNEIVCTHNKKKEQRLKCTINVTRSPTCTIFFIHLRLRENNIQTSGLILGIRTSRYLLLPNILNLLKS